MPRTELKFPDPRTAGPEGLLCIGGNLEVSSLVQAYRLGIFPWPQEGYRLLWFCPESRGILEFSQLHWPRRFRRSLKDSSYHITFNYAFDEVIKECARVPRSHEKGTWILPTMIEAYRKLHENGFAHSVECWQNGVLVGGLYGVFVDGVMSGESMFHHVSDASKRCLYALVQRLSAHGIKWMDIQMVTPVLEVLGGKYIERDTYLEWVQEAQSRAGVRAGAEAGGDPGGNPGGDRGLSTHGDASAEGKKIFG